jgi:predicted secreted protein
MPGVITLVAIYLTIWWVALFAILPLGVQSRHDV